MLTQLPRVPGFERRRCSRHARVRARILRPLKAGPGRRYRQRAVGADGHDRPGAAHRVRERREPAAGARRRPPAGAGHSRRARRRMAADRARAADSRASLLGVLRRRARPRRWRMAALRVLVAIGAGEPAAARRRSRSTRRSCSSRSRVSARRRRRSSALIPVFKYAAPHLGTALRAGGRTLSQSRERHRARNTLVVVQVALALVLLVGSGLMIRTFQALRQRAARLHAAGELLTLRISIPDARSRRREQVIRMQQRHRREDRRHPGRLVGRPRPLAIPMDGTTAGPIRSSPRTSLCARRTDSAAPPITSSSRPGLLQDHGQRVDRRAGSHLDRPLRKAPVVAGLREPGARTLATTRRPPSASASARIAEGAVARSRRRRGQRARRRRRPEGADHRVLADPDGRLRRTTP